MGVSTNAILFYGYVWDEEKTLFSGDDEWSDSILEKRHIKDPWKKFPKEYEQLEYQAQREASDAWVQKHRNEIDSYNDSKKKVEEEFGVDIGYHCSDSCSMPYVYIKESEILARRGYPKIVTTSNLIVKPSWNDSLKTFIKEINIEVPHEDARWNLVSYWG